MTNQEMSDERIEWIEDKIRIMIKGGEPWFYNLTDILDVSNYCENHKFKTDIYKHTYYMGQPTAYSIRFR